MEKNTGYILWQTANAWNRKMENSLAPLKISQVQFILMAGLDRFTKNKCHIRQRDLSKYCRTDINVTSQALRKLEAKGMIERIYRKGNNKSRYPVLTDLGKTTLAKAHEISETNHIEFFKDSDLGSHLTRLLR
jgi:DNA-binding MarR family transcriptional regulator